jgi:glucosamine--fructose-6-phosphate aminotransferase (isomerizing)
MSTADIRSLRRNTRVRWATHGGVTEPNAHPHTDDTGTICIVHNGIIENYAAAAEATRGEGPGLQTETDTEVLATLISELYDPEGGTDLEKRRCRRRCARSPGRTRSR